NTAGAFACLIFALHLCMMGVGKNVPIMTLLLAFALPTMLGRISALPGGVGVTEFGMTGILNAAPDVSLNEAAAAVTIFRLGTVLFTAMAGGLVYFTWWRVVPKEATA
ncbi:MAG TPA: YbhN family protein, partial [Fimbriimonadaceae bacterium]|nr:YbhN family protein [Fimbriimonadaceae bacterium]